MRVYGVSNLDPGSRKQKKGKCIAEVWGESGWSQHQCVRKLGFGPDGDYCKQHANMIEAGRKVSVPKDV